MYADGKSARSCGIVSSCIGAVLLHAILAGFPVKIASFSIPVSGTLLSKTLDYVRWVQTEGSPRCCPYRLVSPGPPWVWAGCVVFGLLSDNSALAARLHHHRRRAARSHSKKALSSYRHRCVAYWCALSGYRRCRHWGRHTLSRFSF